MSLSNDVMDRLYNWKFDSARGYMFESDTDVTDYERETVNALADTFGDVGWFYGSMRMIVRAAVRSLGIWNDLEDEND